jgi:hypothetical protein
MRTPLRVQCIVHARRLTASRTWSPKPFDADYPAFEPSAALTEWTVFIDTRRGPLPFLGVDWAWDAVGDLSRSGKGIWTYNGAPGSQQLLLLRALSFTASGVTAVSHCNVSAVFCSDFTNLIGVGAVSTASAWAVGEFPGRVYRPPDIPRCRREA